MHISGRDIDVILSRDEHPSRSSRGPIRKNVFRAMTLIFRRPLSFQLQQFRRCARSLRCRIRQQRHATPEAPAACDGAIWSPTTFMPSINGPSMTSMGRPAPRRASSVSSMINSLMPLTRAWIRRSVALPSRQVRSSAFRLPPPRTSPATAAPPPTPSGRHGNRNTTSASKLQLDSNSAA